jgi:hypothetical protein
MDERDYKAMNEEINQPLRGTATSRSTFMWEYRYVKEGQLEPDEHGRWAIDCYMFVHIDKALPKYKWYKEMLGKKHLPVRVATMHQNGSTAGSVHSTINKFCVTMPTFEDAGNIGFSTQRNFFSNDIEELKAIVEKEFEHLRTVFRYCI